MKQNSTAEKQMSKPENQTETTYSHFQEFWPKYVQEHRHPLNQRMHFIGTNIAVMMLLSALVLKNPWLILAAMFSGYGFAWVGHFFVEKNRPLTFKYPLMSLRADFKAFGLTWKKIILYGLPDMENTSLTYILCIGNYVLMERFKESTVTLT